MSMVGNEQEQGSDLNPLIAVLAQLVACEVVSGLEREGRVPTREACERVLTDARRYLDVSLGGGATVSNESGQPGTIVPEREGSTSTTTGSRPTHHLPPRILVVANDLSTRASLVRILERDEYIVESSSSIQEVVMHDIIPDLVLSVSSPDVTMRQAYLCAPQIATPIVLLGPDNDDAVVAAFNAGADDYMRLSMPSREFLVRVQATLRRGMALRYAQHIIPSQVTSVQTGALIIDINRGAVTRDRQPIALTPVEARVLMFLARRIGRMVPTAEIVEGVWSGERLAGNPLWITMSRLRRKIEPDPAHPIYLTKGVRGAYSLAQLAVEGEP